MLTDAQKIILHITKEASLFGSLDFNDGDACQSGLPHHVFCASPTGEGDHFRGPVREHFLVANWPSGSSVFFPVCRARHDINGKPFTEIARAKRLADGKPRLGKRPCPR